MRAEMLLNMKDLTVNILTLKDVNSPKHPTVVNTIPQKNPSPMVERLRWTSLQILMMSCVRTAKIPTHICPTDNW